MSTLLPDGLSLLAFWMLVASRFATSALTAVFRIGGGVPLLAILASLVPPVALIPIHGVVQLGSNAGRAAMLRAHVHRPALGVFLVGALVGCGLGGLVAVDLPPAAVQAGVGLFVIWSVLARPPAWLSKLPRLAGALSSFLTMFFGATGPFVAAYVKAFVLPRHAHVATHAVLMTAQHALKVVVFGLLGFAYGPWLFVCIALVFAGLGGTWAGGRVLNHMSDTGFRRALDVVLLVVGARLVWAGLMG